MPKQGFIAMTCDSKLHTILWHVISVKWNIGLKITISQMMTMDREKI